jgi:hypothetical protein
MMITLSDTLCLNLNAKINEIYSLQEQRKDLLLFRTFTLTKFNDAAVFSSCMVLFFGGYGFGSTQEKCHLVGPLVHRYLADTIQSDGLQ